MIRGSVGPAQEDYDFHVRCWGSAA
jgi:hypothetical protein